MSDIQNRIKNILEIRNKAYSPKRVNTSVSCSTRDEKLYEDYANMYNINMGGSYNWNTLDYFDKVPGPNYKYRLYNYSVFDK